MLISALVWLLCQSSEKYMPKTYKINKSFGISGLKPRK